MVPITFINFLTSTALANTPDELDEGVVPPSQDPFSWKDWGFNIGSGFIQEGYGAFKDLFSLKGAVTALALHLLIRRVPFLFGLSITIGNFYGAYQILSGGYHTVMEDGQEAELGGKDIGRALFYLLPFIHGYYVGSKNRSYLKIATEAHYRGGFTGRRLNTPEDYNELVTLLRGELVQITKGLSFASSKRVYHAYDHPQFESESFFARWGNRGAGGLVFLDGKIRLNTSSNPQDLPPLEQTMANVMIAVIKVHEAVHLAQRERRFPKLIDYCANNSLLNSHGLMRRFFKGPNYPPVKETFKSLYVPLKAEEREAHRISCEVVKKHLAGIDWKYSQSLLRDSLQRASALGNKRHVQNCITIADSIAELRAQLALDTNVHVKMITDRRVATFALLDYSPSAIAYGGYTYCVARNIRDWSIDLVSSGIQSAAEFVEQF